MSFTAAEIIGSIGVFLLLLAFFLNLFGYWQRSTRAYQLVNVFGAGLSCYSSYLIEFPPFVVLEGTWCVVAIVAFVKSIRANPMPSS